jgi:hypothetical protein
MSKEIEIVKAIGEAVKALPDTAKEGRQALEASFTAFLTNKKFNMEDLAAALWGSSASTWETAKALQVAVTSHAQLSQRTRDIIEKGIDALKPLAEKASTPEERKEVQVAIVNLCAMARDEGKEDRAFLLQAISIMGGTILLSCGIVVFIKNPKLGQDILKTAVKLIKR